MSESNRTIIIGAGTAGLSAAEELQKNGQDYVILEARDRLGGRVHSVPDGGVFLEYGAAWFHDYEHNEVAKFAEDNEDKVFTSKFDDDRTVLYDTNGHINQDLIKEVGTKLDEFTNQQKYANAPLNDAAFSFSDTLKNKDEKRALDAIVNSIPLATGVPTTKVQSKIVPPNGRDKAVEGGYQNLVVELLGRDVDHSKVKLGTQVNSVSYTQAGVVVNTESGENYEGKAVIVTLPIGALKSHKVEFQPPLHNAITESLKKTEVAKVEKVYLTFPEAFWDSSIFKYVISDPESPALVWNFDSVHPSKTDGHTLAVLVSGQIASHLDAKQNQAFELVLPILKAVSDGKKIPDPSSVSTSRWIADKYSAGAFSAVPLGSTREELATPFINGDKRLLFAGEHAVVEGAGLVQGAWASGTRAAQQVISLK